VNDLAPLANAVPLLVTITLGYSIEQDRIRLRGVDANGKTLTLWLTARLLNRLIPHLIKRQAAITLSNTNPELTGADALESIGKQSNEVQCAPGSPELLVTSIDLSIHEGQLLLLFKDAEETCCVAFLMPPEVLQQWNAGLKQCFEQAGWSQSVFQPQTPSGAASHGAITIH